MGVLKHDKKINVWGCFAWSGVGTIRVVEGILEKNQMKKILREEVKPSVDKIWPDKWRTGDFVFQQDNDPKHTSNLIKEYLAKQKYTTLDWPANSPDLNPIENLWSILNRAADNRTCNDTDELFEVLKDAWESISVDILHNLVESMPRRLALVIKEKGGPIPY
jgi:hypothetical protein